ncbi:MAG: DinB family protein, partial [Vicinamibacterales bacterium]
TIAFLRSEGDTFASFLEGLPESFLAEQLAMAPGMQPPSKSRFEMLLGAKEHEMHHRAQLMTMQRMIGQVPHLTRQMQERMAAMAAQSAAPAQA